MAWTTLGVILSEELKQRMEAAALQQGKSLNIFVQEALFTYVEDIEDGAIGDVALTEDGLEHYLGEGVIPVALAPSIPREPKNSLRNSPLN